MVTHPGYSWKCPKLYRRWCGMASVIPSTDFLMPGQKSGLGTSCSIPCCLPNPATFFLLSKCKGVPRIKSLHSQVQERKGCLYGHNNKQPQPVVNPTHVADGSFAPVSFLTTGTTPIPLIRQALLHFLMASHTLKMPGICYLPIQYLSLPLHCTLLGSWEP
jgi:hypothetical protein